MPVVSIYEGANFRGASANLEIGQYDWGQLGIANGTLSSLRVPPGMAATLYENVHFIGRSKTFTQDASYVGDDFNDITSSIVVSNVSSPSNVAEQVLKLVNWRRSEAGLAPLSLNAQLMNSAQGHSQDMADHNFLGHNGSDGSSPFDRMREPGYNFSSAAENVAAGQPTPEQVVSDWMSDDAHRQNILGPSYRDIGIGYAFRDGTDYKHYWTQDFGG